MLHKQSSPWMAGAAVAVLAVAATIGGVFGGPPLGDHEAIVAECARNMRISGDWVVPWFLDIPFMRKPPLPYWLVAATSYVFPNDATTGMPVTGMVARLPSALAGLGTVLLLWRLGSAMFGWRVGRIAAVLSASSVMFLLFSPNATVEMILTFCCTWAALHFWMAVTKRRTAPRLLHLLLFYIALGAAMLAKGPAPMALLAVPLAVWWYTEKPLRLVAGGRARARYAPMAFVRGLKTQTIRAFTRMWVIPGLAVFALCFVPWMMAVASRHPHAWDLWNWQYVQRAEGNYLDTRDRGVLYYVPLVIGFAAPWLFLLPEALAGPWLKRYVRARRALLFCGTWAVVGIAIMSLEPFRKPYYILPSMPPLMLMMAVAAERFYTHCPANARRAWILWGAAAVALAAALLVGNWQAKLQAPDAATPIMLIALAATIALLLAGIAYIRGRGWLALGATAAITIAAFQSIWYVCGPVVADMNRVTALEQALKTAGAPPNANLLWADMRPDSRLAFYYGRRNGYMIQPAQVVTAMVDGKGKRGENRVAELALDRASELLSAPEPVYLILERGHYELMRMFVDIRAFVVATVPISKDRPSKDWLIISNVKSSITAEGRPLKTNRDTQ